jgi:arsenate reductase (thioredoxin)
MAEGFTRAMANDSILPASTSTGMIVSNPLTFEVMKEAGVDISTEAQELKQTLKQHFGYVVVLYDAAKERAPVFPFTRRVVKWNVPDPVAVEGSGEGREATFRRVRDDIKGKVEAFLNESGLKKLRAA